MEEKFSLEWRLQKGGLGSDVDIIDGANYSLRDGRSLAGVMDQRRVDTVYYVKGSELRKNCLIYEKRGCRGMKISDAEIKRNPGIDAVLSNIHLPFGSLTGGLLMGYGSKIMDPSSDPFNTVALVVGGAAIGLISYIIYKTVPWSNGSGGVWKKYKEMCKKKSIPS